MGYVIYFYSNKLKEKHCNTYGYWTGKSYTKLEEVFPICNNTIDDSVKVYSSKARAINGAEKAYLKFGYVSAYDIEQLN